MPSTSHTDEHSGAVGEHLEPALALRVAPDLAVRGMKPQFGRNQARDHRGMPRENSDLADGGARGELFQLPAEHLALGGEDLGLERVPVVGHLPVGYWPASEAA